MKPRERRRSWPLPAVAVPPSVSLIWTLAALLSTAGCKPPPQGRPIYTPIPESLQPQTIQPASPETREEVRIDVEVYVGEQLVLDSVFETLVDSESDTELRDDAGHVHVITVDVAPADPKTGSHRVAVRYTVDDELLIEDVRHPLPRQTVAFEGPNALRLELVVHPLTRSARR